VDLTDTTHQRALLYLHAMRHDACPVGLSRLQHVVDRYCYGAGNANLSHVLPAIQRSLSTDTDKHQATPPKLTRSRIGYQGD
jgi:hypothetical protein